MMSDDMDDAHEQIIDQLSDYVDGELTPPRLAELERHIAGCGECRTIVAELRSVKERAVSLPNIPPRMDLWDGVADRLSEARPASVTPIRQRARRTFAFTMPQLAAAGIALMIMSGGLVWLAERGDSRADFPAVSASLETVENVPSAPSGRAENASLVDTHYDGAVEDLEKILDDGRDRLDPETIRILEQNLETIDKAIDQSRRALEADPSNTYLNNHLAAARQRKLALLRRATALTIGS
jgi:tetratricopeptide (TPR) repeat protein